MYGIGVYSDMFGVICNFTIVHKVVYTAYYTCNGMEAAFCEEYNFVLLYIIWQKSNLDLQWK